MVELILDYKKAWLYVCVCLSVRLLFVCLVIYHSIWNTMSVCLIVSLLGHLSLYVRMLSQVTVLNEIE